MTGSGGKSTASASATSVDAMTYLSPKQTRERLGVSGQRLRQRDMDAALQPIRIGRQRIYSRERVAFVDGMRTARKDARR